MKRQIACFDIVCNIIILSYTICGKDFMRWNKPLLIFNYLMIQTIDTHNLFCRNLFTSRQIVYEIFFESLATVQACTMFIWKENREVKSTQCPSLIILLNQFHSIWYDSSSFFVTWHCFTLMYLMYHIIIYKWIFLVHTQYKARCLIILMFNVQIKFFLLLLNAEKY